MPTPTPTHVLVLSAAPGTLPEDLLARLSRALGPARTLSEGEAAEFPCSPDFDPALGTAPVDHAILPAQGRRKRLLLADMDSTVVTGETLDELAGVAGVGTKVAAITARSMNGELDFAAALRERVALLKGLPLSALDQTWSGVRLSPGARTLVQTMRANGAHTALVSGGFTWFTSRVAALCGFHAHHANTLLDDGHTLLGTVATPILDRAAKLHTLQALTAAHHLTPADTMAVGDGANDLDMLRAAALGVAFHAKPVVAAEARVRITHTTLRSLLFLQGYTAAEFVE